MKKNKVIKDLCILLGIILFSILIEIFVYHFSLLQIDKNNRKITEISDYKKYTDDENDVIEIKLKNQYINKFNIIYDTNNDISYTLTYLEDNYYKKKQETIISDIFDNEVNKTILNLNNRVSKVKITYSSEEKLNIKQIQIDNRFKINYFRIIFLTITFLLIYFIISFYKKGFSSTKLHHYFFIVSLLIGTTLIILQPPTTYYSWDDQVHFKNVNELSSRQATWNIGEFSMIDSTPIGRGSINSKEEQENQMKYLNTTKKSNYSSESKKFITYNQIAYIPSAIGFRISRLIGIPFSISFKIGKWFNLLFYLSIVSYAIKISSINKRLVTVIGMIPTSLFLASQYSYDAAVTSGILLSMVMLTNWFIDKKFPMNFKNLLIFIAAILYGCFPKAVYIPLILLFLFIPKDRFQNKTQSIRIKLGIFLLFLGMMSTFVLPTVSSDNIAGDSRGGNTSVSEQLKVIMKHPLGYIHVLEDTMISNFSTNILGKENLVYFSYIYDNYKKAYTTNHTSETEGTDLGNNLYYLFLILLIFVAMTDDSQYKLTNLQRISGIVLVVGVITLIWTALYLSFTPVGLTTINGVQPRYFIPLLLPLFLCIRTSKIKHKIPDNIYNLCIISIPTIVMMITIYQSVLVYYCM